MNQDRREHGLYVQTQMEFYDRIVVVVVVFYFNETVFHFQFFVDKRSPDVKDGSESETRSL